MPSVNRIEATKFRTIVADPPWPYTDSGTVRIGTDHHYTTMTLGDIERLDIPAAEESHLYLWTTNSFIVEAHRVAKLWGFTVKTILTWGKIQKSVAIPSVGMGHYFRGATEHILFGVRGNLKLNKGVCRTTLLLSEREPHSVKPDWFYRMCEKCSPGPRLDIFARRKRIGWSSWGNEIDSDVNIRSRNA